VTTNVPYDVFRALSEDEQCTVVVPAGKSEPESG
jgi:hypothetical protein